MYEIHDTDDIDAWRDRFEALTDAGPYHGPDYLAVLEGRFEFEAERAECFVYTDGDGTVYYPYLARPVATAPFDAGHENHRDIVSSWYYGGPIVDADGDATALVEGFLDAFEDHCSETDVVAEFVRFDPNLGNHEDLPQLDPSFDRETVPVALTQSEDAIWEGFEKRNRNAIRQAQDTDLVVEPTERDADYDAFYGIYVDAMEAKDASDHYRFDRSFFTTLRDAGLGSLVVSRYEGEVVGGALVVHDGRIAHDYLRASEPDYWDLRVNNLLCYEALMTMKRRGHETFDFQGGRPGVFKFKKSFSPDRREFHLARRVHDDETYDALVEEAADAGIETDSGYFPAYRAEQSN